MKDFNIDKVYDKAMSWIDKNTIHGNGITVTSKRKVIYPEVTGYYIPTLIRWNDIDRAKAYAKYLCSIQKPDGSWYDCWDKAPYIFDSAQILKGLVAIRGIMPEVDTHIIKGCDWILGYMQPDGRLLPPDTDSWGDDPEFCSELIHTYCLQPLVEAGKLLGRVDYTDMSSKILNYYITTQRDKIENFSLLSHFYAYVMEAMCDLGELDLCRISMNNLEKYKNSNGGIPGLNNVSWVCSTGMFQLAIVWYKLGELEKGNELFDYTCSLQNESGGWFGSYPTSKLVNSLSRGKKKAYYFPDEEISWAVKYFLDAYYYKNKLEESRKIRG